MAGRDFRARLWRVMTGAGVALCACLQRGASAGPLNLAHVDSRAAWLVHIDVETLMSSPLGTSLLQQPGSALHQFAGDMQADMGIDPATDIRSLTLFSNSSDDREGVAILVTTAGGDRMATVLQEQHPNGLEITRHGSDEVYSWELRGSRWFGCIKRENETMRIVLLSQTRESVVNALDVIEGRRASLAGENVPDDDCTKRRLDPKPCTRSFCYLAASSEAWRGTTREPRTEVFRGARLFTFDTSEQIDESGSRWMTSRLQLRMENAEAAENARKMVDGAVAWVKLIGEREQAPACARQAVNSIVTSREGGDVLVHAKVRMEDFTRVISMMLGDGAEVENGIRVRLAIDPKQDANRSEVASESRERSKKRDTPSQDRAKNTETAKVEQQPK